MAPKTTYPELPYTPIVAKDLGQDDELAEIARRHLGDAGPGSLRAEIPFLRLQRQSNLQAAYNLLDDTNKGKVSYNTLVHAKNLCKLAKANDSEQSAQSAEKLHAYLQPDSDHENDAELEMTFAMARIAVQVTKSRQQSHSHEFRARGREFLHFKVLIGLQLEAIEDHRNRSHRGFFVRKLLSGPKKKQPEKRQESDDEDDSDDVRPMVKKRRVVSAKRNAAVLKMNNSDNQDNSADLGKATDVQPDIAHLHQQEAQSSGARDGSHPPPSKPQYSGRKDESDEVDKTRSTSLDTAQPLPEQGVKPSTEPSANSTGFRARRTRRPIITAPCTTCGKEIPCGPSRQPKQCVACQRKAQALSVVHQQVPAPVAVMVAPTAVMVPPRFAPTAVMVAPGPPTGQSLQLQSAPAQDDSSKIEVLEQMIRKHEVEKDGLKAIIREQSNQLEGLRRENVQLKARNQQLEEQT